MNALLPSKPRKTCALEPYRRLSSSSGVSTDNTPPLSTSPHEKQNIVESTNETYNHLVDKLNHKLQDLYPHQKYWVAIAGGPGSGKTTSAMTIAHRINTRCDRSVAIVIPMDGFHYAREELMAQYGGPDALRRRGAPWTIDANAIYQKLQEIRQYGRADLPTYNRKESNPVLDGVHVEMHHQILLVEGLYLLHTRDPAWAPLDEFWDERWFVQAPTRDIQVERLLNRRLQTWSFSKAEQWGTGREGAEKLVRFNDVKNMDLVEYCVERADEVIVTVSD
jgi:pantothenate kinase